MNIYINQPFGIGDCIFAVSIARKYINEGHSVTWGVLPHFVLQLQNAYPDINWVNYLDTGINHDDRTEHDSNGYRVLPLRWAGELLNYPYEKVMRAKYDLLHLDFNEWDKNAMWNRNFRKEIDLLELLKEKHNIRKGKYVFVNRYFGSNINTRVKPIALPYETTVIEMRPYEGYSLFDWASVLEEANEVHTVSTSILYIIEQLNLKKKVHLYPRPTDLDFAQVKYLLKKEYRYYHKT